MSSTRTPIKLIDHYQVWQSDDVLQIRGANKSLVLKGLVVKRVLPRLLPLLDGSLAEEEIRAKVGAEEDGQQLLQVLEVLGQRGLIERIEPAPEALAAHAPAKVAALAKHYKHTTTSRWTPLLAMQTTPLVLSGHAELLIPLALNLAGLLARELLIVADAVSASDAAHSRYLTGADVGASVADVIRRQLPSDSACVVRAAAQRPQSVLEWRELLAGSQLVVTAHCMPVVFNPELDALNRAVLAEGVRWLPVAVLDNREVQIGPAVVPAETACYKCFEYRFRSNFTHLESYDHFARALAAAGEVVDFGVLGPFAELAANYAAIEAMKLISPEHVPESAGRLLSISLDSLSAKHHPVLRIPRCPHCSEHVERCPERVWA
jgi:bacteriocin biosynthesis cyclodehydratase domain-containing protein